MQGLPLIDISSLRQGGDRSRVAAEIRAAAIDKGFFYIKGHGVDPKLEAQLEDLSLRFFALHEAEKAKISMAHAGRAWRGFFPLGGELTSGKPDWKEGLYFGEEHSADHPLVKAQVPLHGANLFPSLPGFRETVLRYITAMNDLAQIVLEGMALSLGLEADFFRQGLTREPTLLFRIFHYPPPPAGSVLWGVGEHTDYGLLTILKQDEVGGLEVKSHDGWIQAPPISGSYVCNIGDMLDRLTRGLYRSTPHRVQNSSGRERYSFPFFFDPGFGARIEALPLDTSLFPAHVLDASVERWDRANVHSFEGTYGDYLLAKVGKVFPDLKASI